MLVETDAGGPLLIADAQAANMTSLKSFLSRNGQPHRLVDPSADADSAALAARYAPGTQAAVLVVCPNGHLLTNPSEVEVAHAIGLCEFDSAPVRDLAIVGAGQAGLAAAVYAASEGLSVIVLEAHDYGSQAGASSRIENYLGFPAGITG